MKTILSLLIFLVINGSVFAQKSKQKELLNKLEPSLWMNIVNLEQSDKDFKIVPLNYYQIPEELEFKGTVVEAVKWNDIKGEKILILTNTGTYEAKEYSGDSTGFIIHDRAEIDAYLFTKRSGASEYDRQWKFRDYSDCFNVDRYAGFIPNAATITDLDKDGVSEITFAYTLICRNDKSSAVLKLIMMEGVEKYSFDGFTVPDCNNLKVGGNYVSSSNLKYNSTFMDYLQKVWNAQKCENDRF